MGNLPFLFNLTQKWDALIFEVMSPKNKNILYYIENHLKNDMSQCLLIAALRNYTIEEKYSGSAEILGLQVNVLQQMPYEKALVTINKSYIEKIKKVHPDTNNKGPNAHEQSCEINLAHDSLLELLEKISC